MTEQNGMMDEGQLEASAPQPFTMIDTIKVFGKELGPVSAEDMEKLSAGPDAEVHLARHFRALSDEYKQQLIGQSYKRFDPAQGKEVDDTITADVIDKALATKGSKYYEHISGLENPHELIEKVRSEAVRLASEGKVVWYDSGFAKKAMLTIDMPQPVGTDGVVKLENLTDDQRANLTQAARGKLAGDEFTVNMAANVEGPATSKISAIIGWINGQPAPVIFTAYPGELAADFPKDTQGQDEREYNKQFWAERAFIA